MSCLLRAISKSSKALALAGLAAVSQPSFADDSTLGGIKDALGPSGSLRLGLFDSDKRYTGNEPVTQGSAWLTLRPKEVAEFRGYFEGYLYGENLERKFEGKAEIREGYLERSFGLLDVRAGRQVTVWGRADKVNPTDPLSLRDQRLLFSDDEEQRLGIAALQTVANFDGWRLIGVWQPEWRRPRFAFPPLPAGVTVTQRDPSSPAEQFALKWDRTGSDFDASLSYFYGYDKTPDFALESAGPAGVALGLIHRPVHVVGTDFATSLGSYGIRAEAAYTFTQDSTGNDPLVKNRGLFAVVGADRNLATDLNLNVQYLLRYTQDFAPLSSIADPTTRQVAAQAYFVANQTQSWLHGVSARLNYKLLHETLELEGALVWWFNRGDFLVRPKVTYAVSDSIKASAGAEWFGGGAGSFFGTLKPLSNYYGELRWSY